MDAEGNNRNSGKPGKHLSRAEKIISTGLVAVTAVLWGVYGPGLMKDSLVEKWMDTNLGVAILFTICIAVSCTILYVCRGEEHARNGESKDVAADMAPKGGRADRGDPNDKASSPRVWTKWHPASIPWLITLPLLLTMNFKWQGLISGLWVLVAFLIVLWDYFAKTEPNRHLAKPDRLGRGFMYSRFGDKIRVLTGEEDKGLSIVVTGEWGSGKSHFINATVASLEENYEARNKLYRENLPGQAYKGKFVAVNVDLWQASSVEAMWQDVARALLCMLNGHDADMDNLLTKIMNGLLSLLPFNMTNEVKEVVRFVTTGGDNCVFSNNLIRRFKLSPQRYILVMDNVERCNPLILSSVFSLIERLNIIPHLVVICGIAMDGEALPISISTPEAQSALLKIFDIPFVMPLLTQEQSLDYLNVLLDEVEFDCPYFKAWCKRCKIELATPRFLEKLVSKLSLLDNLYLSRYETELSHNMVDWEGNSVINLIFDFEALRLAYPDISYPYKQKMDIDKDMDSVDVYKNWRESFMKKIVDVGNFNKGGDLSEISKRVFDATARALDSIANREYLRISSLTDKESEQLLDSYREGIDPRTALRKAYEGAYSPNIENDIIRGICKYCIGHSDHKASLPFMEAFCTMSLDLNLLPRYTATNLIVLVQSEFAMRSRWQNCLKSIIRIYPVEWLAEEVSKIVDYIGKEKERIEIRYELSSRLTTAANNILDGYGSDEKNSDKLNVVADQLLSEYAKKACAFILDSPSLNDHGMYKYLMLAQAVTPKDYAHSLKKGVQEFINSAAREAYKNNLAESIRRLLRSIIIRSHHSETLELVDMPFAVLSFAVIWSNLICGLLGQRKLSTEELTIVEERLATISTMSKEKKDSKRVEQFWRNRETAMRILRTTLERLKKKANE